MKKMMAVLALTRAFTSMVRIYSLTLKNNLMILLKLHRKNKVARLRQ